MPLAPTREAQDRFIQERSRASAGQEQWRCCSWWSRRARQEHRALCGYTWQYWLTTRSVNPAEYRRSSGSRISICSSDCATVAARTSRAKQGERIRDTQTQLVLQYLSDPRGSV